jgi:hypothetical protein
MLERARVDRFVDFASVVLISVAAVLTAVCGYQSGRWGGDQLRLYNVANANRIASAEAEAKGNAQTAIDVVLFLEYLNAVAANDSRKAEFVRRRFPGELRVAMDAWVASKPLHNPNAPSSPFVMPQYTLQTAVEAKQDAKAADADFADAQEANRRSDAFLLLTVIFASVSFLAGISTKMTYPRHAIVVGVATIGLLYGTVRLVGLPFL